MVEQCKSLTASVQASDRIALASVEQIIPSFDFFVASSFPLK